MLQGLRVEQFLLKNGDEECEGRAQISLHKGKVLDYEILWLTSCQLLRGCGYEL
jgi:hypothetical protein